MVGIFAFDHAHAHGSHGHGHSHGHSHNPAHSHSLGHSHSPNLGNDESKSIHAHSHGGDNMHGIYLHILADLLGSVSVVISTVLIHYTNWPGFDPLASMLIAIMIFASAIPLVKSSAKNLLLTVNTSTEYNLREAISGISALPGVRAYQATRFWETGDGMLRGVVHVTAEGDRQAVKRRVEDWLNTGLERVDVTVVVERGDDPQCWCQKD
jgi:zinc transporter 5/7